MISKTLKRIVLVDTIKTGHLIQAVTVGTYGELVGKLLSPQTNLANTLQELLRQHLGVIKV
jgi:hypothetical protein